MWLRLTFVKYFSVWQHLTIVGILCDSRLQFLFDKRFFRIKIKLYSVEIHEVALTMAGDESECNTSTSSNSSSDAASGGNGKNENANETGERQENVVIETKTSSDKNDVMGGRKNVDGNTQGERPRDQRRALKKKHESSSESSSSSSDSDSSDSSSSSDGEVSSSESSSDSERDNAKKSKKSKSNAKKTKKEHQDDTKSLVMQNERDNEKGHVSTETKKSPTPSAERQKSKSPSPRKISDHTSEEKNGKDSGENSPVVVEERTKSPALSSETKKIDTEEGEITEEKENEKVFTLLFYYNYFQAKMYFNTFSGCIVGKRSWAFENWQWF